jgi:hypothetical protein
MTRSDQALLDKQFRWLDQSRADGLLALCLLTTILFCVLLSGASTG